MGARGAAARRRWTDLFEAYRAQYGALANEIDLMQRRELPANWDSNLPVFPADPKRSEEHTSELQSRLHLVCRLLLEKKKKTRRHVVLQLKQNDLEHRSRQA